MGNDHGAACPPAPACQPARSRPPPAARSCAGRRWRRATAVAWQILLEDGAVDAGDLLKATVIQQKLRLRLDQVLLAQGMVQPAALARALSRQWRTTAIDPDVTPADPRLIDDAGAGFCLTHGLLPWRRIGGVTWIATARPDDFAAVLPLLPRQFGQVRMLLCSADQAQGGVLNSRRTRLIREAETRVPAIESCRTQDQARTARLAIAALALTAAGLILVPTLIVGLLTFWAVLTLLTQSGLKLASFLAARRALREQDAHALAIRQGHPAPR